METSFEGVLSRLCSGRVRAKLRVTVQIHLCVGRTHDNMTLCFPLAGNLRMHVLGVARVAYADQHIQLGV